MESYGRGQIQPPGGNTITTPVSVEYQGNSIYTTFKILSMCLFLLGLWRF